MTHQIIDLNIATLKFSAVDDVIGSPYKTNLTILKMMIFHTTMLGSICMCEKLCSWKAWFLFS